MLINLSLSDAAEKAGVSTAYLSTLFPRTWDAALWHLLQKLQVILSLQ